MRLRSGTKIDFPGFRSYRVRVKVSNALKQAYDFRDSLYQLYNQGVASEKPDEFKLATIISSWCKVDERIRIHTGRPLPGVLKPQDSRTKARVIPGSVAPLEIQDAVAVAAGPAVDNLAVAAAADTAPDIESDDMTSEETIARMTADRSEPSK